jgi:hypothetical protein
MGGKLSLSRHRQNDDYEPNSDSVQGGATAALASLIHNLPKLNSIRY